MEKAQQTFEQALDRVKPLTDTIFARLKGLTVEADETQIEFGLKLNASSSVVIAGSSLESNFKITMKWKRRASDGHSN